MRQTLFYIPHELFGLPVFGLGWLLIAWVVICLLLLVRAWRQGQGRSEILGMLPMMILVAAAIALLVPRIEESIPPGALVFPPAQDALQGLPIRGYGVMLMLAVLLGVSLAANRAARAGLNPEVIYSLAFALVLGGIVGARLFFALQYWELIRGPTWGQTLVNLVSVVKGGLVVYGSLIGAAMAFVVFCRLQRLPPLPLADLIAPSLALGLALGRIGCLLNGCCFGDVCPPEFALAVRFPTGSPPYLRQLEQGQLLGVRWQSDPAGGLRVEEVDPQSVAARVGLKRGQRIVAIAGRPVRDPEDVLVLAVEPPQKWEFQLADGTRIRLPADTLPAHSLPVHPTQIYSAVNAGLLFLLTLLYYPFRRRHGEVIAGLLTLYAPSRFLLEMIRTDEADFLANLTISQNVSLVIGLGLVLLWVYVWKQPELSASTARQ